MPLSDRWEFWSEFKWEKILRKNDARVSIYLQELPQYIDLPGETEILEHKIFQQIPADPVWDDILDLPGSQFANCDDDDDDDDDDGDPDDNTENNSIPADEDWNKREGAEIFMISGQLSHVITCLLAESCDKKVTLFCVQTLTILGKIMAQMQIVIELDPEDRTQLRTAILKRVIKNLTELHNSFSNMMSDPALSMQLYPGDNRISIFFQAIMENLMQMRQTAVDLLKTARN